jgi:hypothetical protein
MKPQENTQTTASKNPVSLHKTVQKREEYFVAFTDEESQALGISAGDKFEIIEEADGILLKKFGTIDLDIDAFDKETLAFLVAESFRMKAPVEEVICEILTKVLEEEEAKLKHLKKVKESSRLDKPEDL